MRHDLKLHRNIGFAIGFVATVAATLALLKLTEVPVAASIGIAVLVGNALAYAAGWAKEYWWDAKGRGTVDRDDLRWTYRGGSMGAGAAAVVLFIIAGALA